MKNLVRFLVFATAVLTALLPGPALAGLDEGLAAYEKKD